MATVITVAIEKGGTGKTTTVVNLAALMAAEGNRVLVVDMDQQANATFMLTQKSKTENVYRGKGLFNMFMAYGEGIEMSNFIHPTCIDGIDIIPSTAQTPRAIGQLAALEEEYSEREYTFLLNSLSVVNDDYDYILIDTPPSRDVLTVSALFAADHVLIPVRCDKFSLDGFETTIHMMKELEKKEEISINLLGILLTQVERTIVSAHIRENFENSDFAEYLMKTVIRKGSAVSDSTVCAVPVVRYAKNTNPARDYTAAWKELKERLAAFGQEGEE